MGRFFWGVNVCRVKLGGERRVIWWQIWSVAFGSWGKAYCCGKGWCCWVTTQQTQQMQHLMCWWVAGTRSTPYPLLAWSCNLRSTTTGRRFREKHFQDSDFRIENSLKLIVGGLVVVHRTIRKWRFESHLPPNNRPIVMKFLNWEEMSCRNFNEHNGAMPHYLES